ncbi:hypothetical protein BGZ95_011902 [Linnemannia exigua]|uniref:F-box domain-containing protein n=1 Tax=Linnemannia exigua TaxID=604196 RepID=A0AAD4H4X8_9FUNG|nr:hypothetical protein BGZ95_011902 [Linnemannia exigua]
MTPACIRFINIPELVAYITPLISRHDLVQLARVNHAFNSTCIPLIWQTLDLQDNAISNRLLNSPQALQAFSRNINSIHAVVWKPNFSWYYIHALWTYLNSAPLPEEHQTISTAVLTHQQWGSMQLRPFSSLVPLPPLLSLSQFKACMTNFPGDKLPPEVPVYDPGRHLHQILWLLRLNSDTLTSLDLTQMNFRSLRVVRDISRTISQLRCLRTLRLGAEPISSHSRQAFDTFFFSCPSSLVDLDFVCRIVESKFVYSLDPTLGDWDFDQGPIVLREVPLLRLKRLGIPAMHHDDLAPVFRIVLEQCPFLEALAIPNLGLLSDDTLFAIASIGELCPHISELSFPEGCLVEHAMMILDGLPRQQLKSLCFRYYQDPDPEPMIATWVQHSNTLQKIELSNCTQVGSIVIQAALTTCEALEWVCTKLRELEIVVWVTANGMSPDYISDQSKVTWEEADHHHWETLGKLYSQIGALTRLEILDLRAVGQVDIPIDHNERVYFHQPSETCLPGLLALEDPSTGQIGYLSKFEPLTRLRELRGSFVWTQKNVQDRIGNREVDWFVDNLPALEVATFKGKDYSEHLQSLELRRPDLKVCQS